MLLQTTLNGHRIIDIVNTEKDEGQALCIKQRSAH